MTALEALCLKVGEDLLSGKRPPPTPKLSPQEALERYNKGNVK